MPKPRVITEQEDFPIKPSDINAAKRTMEVFGNLETEISAGYIVRFMQEKGDWVPFTYGELNAFYKKTCAYIQPGNYSFNRLIGFFCVREGEEKNDGCRFQDSDVFRVTDEFVLRCYRSSGIPRMKPAPQPVG